ncbi:type I-E CRISPR-associated protein Cse2/CasB [Nocardiopsis sp. CNT-189]|uniref:type I-E CRISPR-associated protein Cse2/CasB n=1 Tax=Nocardiopsis oceanisediminis TaxID=2816862 RepID=UPI003B32D5D2
MTGYGRRSLQKSADLMVDNLAERIVSAPGDRAVLRRMVGHPPGHLTARPVHKVIYDCLKDGDGRPHGLPEDPAGEWAFYAVASMMADQPRDARDARKAEAPEESGREESGRGPGAVSPDGSGDAADGDPADSGGEAAPEQEPSGGEMRLRKSERRPNLGVSLAGGVKDGVFKAETTEKRLHRLCRLDLAGLHKRLPALVRHARADLVDLDWGVLVVDLARWESERDEVAKEWLQAYHRTRNYDLYQEQKKKQETAAPAAQSDEQEQ